MKELKAEIIRLARKEIKQELEPIKRVNAAQRGYIADLRREITELQKEINLLKKVMPEEEVKAVEEKKDTPSRFWITGKGVVSLRKRLDLTQAELAALAGVSAQSITKWEKEEGKIPFRQEVTAQRMQEIREMNKTEAREALK
ncbi:MAG TPA: helix-turn-helix domain-containing protein [Tichowtungia sp.]|nr:helix-turn-helix domain-containing protein [Tichowtungia sp.]